MHVVATVIDLAWLATWTKPILASLLITIGIVFFVFPWLKELISRILPKITHIPQPATIPVPKPRNSDAPPPVGIGEFLLIIETTAPNANPSVWWEYAKAEMTEAKVAIAEAKLAKHEDYVPTPNSVKKEEVKT